MSRGIQSLIAAIFLLGSSAAFAEDLKVGYVDMQRALNETEDGRKAKDKLKKEFRDLMKAWRTGDSDKLEKMLNEASREAPAVFKRLVTDRNQRWAPKIEEWSRGNQNVIVVVGAGHLVGSEGVVELLRKKGLKVTQQ